MGLIQKPKWAVGLSSSLQSAFVCIDLSGPNLAANDISLCEHTKLQMFYLRASCQGKALIQVCSPALLQFVLPLYMREFFCHLLARLGLGLPGCLDSYFSQDVLNSRHTNFYVCSAFRLGNPGVWLPRWGTGLASYIVREMEITSFLDPPSLEGWHKLVMQFYLNVMVCLLCTNESLNSCSGAENHKVFFWISIRQKHLP